MLNAIKAHFSEPICSCSPRSVAIYITTDQGSSGVRFECSTCKTSLNIPYSKFIFHFVYDNEVKAKGFNAAIDKHLDKMTKQQKYEELENVMLLVGKRLEEAKIAAHEKETTASVK